MRPGLEGCCLKKRVSAAATALLPLLPLLFLEVELFVAGFRDRFPRPPRDMWPARRVAATFSYAPIAMFTCLVMGISASDGHISLCPSGTFKKEAATSSHNAATAATAACTACPSGSDSPAGSSASTQCTCNVGLTRHLAGDRKCTALPVCPRNTFFQRELMASPSCTTTCLPCGPHSESTQGSSACQCSVGYYSSDANPSGEDCVKCPVGFTTLTLGTRRLSDCTCAAGHGGSFCSPCSQNTWKRLPGPDACAQCPRDTYKLDTGVGCPPLFDLSSDKQNTYALPLLSSTCNDSSIAAKHSRHKSQSLFPGHLLRVSGLRAGSLIDTLVFMWHSPPVSKTKFRLSVGLAQVYPQTILNSMINVRQHFSDDASSSDMSTGRYSITLTTPLVWDGTSSIVVELGMDLGATGNTFEHIGEMLYANRDIIGRSGHVFCDHGLWNFQGVQGVMALDFTTGCTSACRGGYEAVRDNISSLITYQSGHLTQSTLNALKTATDIIYAVEDSIKLPSMGYCNVTDADLSRFNNRQMCGPDGALRNLGLKLTVAFKAPSSGTWGFDFNLNFGHGGVVIIDDDIVKESTQHQWKDDLDLVHPLDFNISLASGWHQMVVVGASSSCNNFNNIRFKAPGERSRWLLMTHANLDLLRLMDPDGISACSICGAGHYSQVNSSACTKCAANTHSVHSGATSCDVCPEMSFALPGSQHCSMAPCFDQIFVVAEHDSIWTEAMSSLHIKLHEANFSLSGSETNSSTVFMAEPSVALVTVYAKLAFLPKDLKIVVTATINGEELSQQLDPTIEKLDSSGLFAARVPIHNQSTVVHITIYANGQPTAGSRSLVIHLRASILPHRAALPHSFVTFVAFVILAAVATLTFVTWLLRNKFAMSLSHDMILLCQYFSFWSDITQGSLYTFTNALGWTAFQITQTSGKDIHRIDDWHSFLNVLMVAGALFVVSIAVPNTLLLDASHAWTVSKQFTLYFMELSSAPICYSALKVMRAANSQEQWLLAALMALLAQTMTSWQRLGTSRAMCCAVIAATLGAFSTLPFVLLAVADCCLLSSMVLSQTLPSDSQISKQHAKNSVLAVLNLVGLCSLILVGDNASDFATYIAISSVLVCYMCSVWSAANLVSCREVAPPPPPVDEMGSVNVAHVLTMHAWLFSTSTLPIPDECSLHLFIMPRELEVQPDDIEENADQAKVFPDYYNPGTCALCCSSISLRMPVMIMLAFYGFVGFCCTFVFKNPIEFDFQPAGSFYLTTGECTRNHQLHASAFNKTSRGLSMAGIGSPEEALAELTEFRKSNGGRTTAPVSPAAQLLSEEEVRKGGGVRKPIRYMHVLYNNTRNGVNIFNDELLKHICQFERDFQNLPGYSDFCATDPSGACSTVSFVHHFFETDSCQRLKPYTERIFSHLMTQKAMHWFFHPRCMRSYDGTNALVSCHLMRSGFAFGIASLAASQDEKEHSQHFSEQIVQLNNWTRVVVLPFMRHSRVRSKQEMGLALFFGGPELTAIEVNDIVFRDGMLSLISLVFIFLLMRKHTQSTLITLAALIQILSALPISYFVWLESGNPRQMQILNILSVFLVLGIGADNFFVYYDTWRFKQSLPLRERLVSTVSSATSTCLATSLTTALAFAASTSMPLRPVQEFAGFMAIVIVVNVVLLLMMTPPLLVLHYHMMKSFSIIHSDSNDDLVASCFKLIFGEKKGGLRCMLLILLMSVVLFGGCLIVPNIQTDDSPPQMMKDSTNLQGQVMLIAELESQDNKDTTVTATAAADIIFAANAAAAAAVAAAAAADTGHLVKRKVYNRHFGLVLHGTSSSVHADRPQKPIPVAASKTFVNSFYKAWSEVTWAERLTGEFTITIEQNSYFGQHRFGVWGTKSGTFHKEVLVDGQWHLPDLASSGKSVPLWPSKSVLSDTLTTALQITGIRLSTTSDWVATEWAPTGGGTISVLHPGGNDNISLVAPVACGVNMTWMMPSGATFGASSAHLLYRSKLMLAPPISLELLKATLDNTPLSQSGFCSENLANFTEFSNRALCLNGSTTQVAYRFKVLFNAPTGGTWHFNFTVDFGWGGSIAFDGRAHQMNLQPVHSFTTKWLSSGAHEMIVYGATLAEKSVSSISFKAPGDIQWRGLSKAELETVSQQNSYFSAVGCGTLGSALGSTGTCSFMQSVAWSARIPMHAITTAGCAVSVFESERLTCSTFCKRNGGRLCVRSQLSHTAERCLLKQELNDTESDSCHQVYSTNTAFVCACAPLPDASHTSLTAKCKIKGYSLQDIHSVSNILAFKAAITSQINVHGITTEQVIVTNITQTQLGEQVLIISIFVASLPSGVSVDTFRHVVAHLRGAGLVNVVNARMFSIVRVGPSYVHETAETLNQILPKALPAIGRLYVHPLPSNPADIADIHTVWKQTPVRQAVDYTSVFVVYGAMQLQGDSVIFDPSFDVVNPATQQSLVDICDKLILSNNVNMSEPLQWPKCFGHALRSTAFTLNRSFPVAEQLAYDTVWRAVLSLGAAQVHSGFLGGRLVVARDEFRVPRAKDSLPDEAMVTHQAFKRILNTMNETLGNNVFATSDTWMKAETTIGIRRGIAVSMLTSSICALACMLLFTCSVIVTVLAAVSIVFILIIVMSGVQLLGWKIGMVEIVGLCLLIGTTVDYLLHIGHAYCHRARSNPDRLGKVRHALRSVGSGIVGAALTTVASMTPLLFCQLVPLFRFGVFLAMACAASMVYSLLFFTVALSITGPVKVRWSRCSVNQKTVDNLPDNFVNEEIDQRNTTDIFLASQSHGTWGNGGNVSYRWFLIPILLIVGIWVWPTVVTAPLCNGSVGFCHIPYINMTFVAAHHAVGVPCTAQDPVCFKEGWVSLHQYGDFDASLEAGVRAFVLSLGVVKGQPHICHRSCKWGRRPLRQVFEHLKEFLAYNTREVVTIIFDDNDLSHGTVPQEEIEGLVMETGLDTFINASASSNYNFGTSLGQLIELQARLLIFSDCEESDMLLSRAKNIASVQLDCAGPNSVASQAAPLMMVRQFVNDSARLGASPPSAAALALPARLQGCREACDGRTHRKSNFMAMDFVTAEGLDAFQGIFNPNTVSTGGRL